MYMYVCIYFHVYINAGFFWQTRGMYNLQKKINSHMKVYLKEEIPDRFPCCKKIQPVILVVDDGSVCVYVCVFREVIGQILGMKIH